MTDNLDLLREGHLNEAIEQASASLKANPKDTAARSLLGELLCIRGDFERADSQLQTLSEFDTDRSEEIAAWRSLIRAAQVRADVFQRAAAPELAREPSQQIRGLLDALVAWHECDPGTADRYDALEAQRSPWPATIDSEPVEDVRELDDRMAGILDVMTTQGQYLWLDVADIAHLQLSPRRRPLDAVWRPAHLMLHDGFSGRVYVPIIYPTPTDDESCLLGRRTDWQERDGAVIGVGQRCWLVGDRDVPLGEIDAVIGPEAEAVTSAAQQQAGN